MIERASLLCITFLMLSCCASVETHQKTNCNGLDELVDLATTLDHEVSAFGKLPHLEGGSVGVEHIEHVQKLRDIHFLSKFDQLCDLANQACVQGKILPSHFFTRMTSGAFESLLLHAKVSVFEDSAGRESDKILRSSIRFLELQRFASRDENWSTLLRNRSRFLNILNVKHGGETPAALSDFLQKELKFQSLEATWYWEAQIRSILDWKELDSTEEQLFLIALLMDAKNRSKAEAWRLHETFIDKSNKVRYPELESLVISDRLTRLFASVDNKEYLKRCHAFWSFKENLEVYRIGLIIRNTIIVRASQGLDPQGLPSTIAAEIQVPYPSAQVRFEADPENKHICWIWVRLGIEESLHAFRLPEVVLQRLPLKFGVQEYPVNDLDSED